MSIKQMSVLKKMFFFSVLVFGFASVSQANSEYYLDSNGILTRSSDGCMVFARHDKLSPDVCSSLGARLPTARELAQFSQAHGAAGILEMTPENSEKAPGGYQKVSALNPDGVKDEFYFRSTGYKSPVGFPNSIEIVFWSSSLDLKYDYYTYVLASEDGHISKIDGGFFAAVLCLPVK